MNLLFNAILRAIDEIARKKELKHYRVLHKRNARGELVIALIVSPDEPCLGSDKIPG